MSEFEHPQLGPIRHIDEEDVLNFLGLKYALLENAFTDPQICSCTFGNVIDATRYECVTKAAKAIAHSYTSPTATSHPSTFDMELMLLQKSLLRGGFASYTTQCLNLNMCIPSDCKGPIPVFLFLHSGGLRIGFNAWLQYNVERFIKLSKAIYKPVIGFQAKYALSGNTPEAINLMI